jgi:hypothetical protein
MSYMIRKRPLVPELKERLGHYRLAYGRVSKDYEENTEEQE